MIVLKLIFALIVFHLLPLYSLLQACGALPSLLDKFKLRLKKKDSDASDVVSRTVACNLSEITERSITLSSR